MAISAAGRIPEAPRIRSVSGKCCSALGAPGATFNTSSCSPSPTESATAKITMLRRVQSTSDSIEIPDATTMPNITMTPPPRTSIGTVRITPPTFGTSPQTIRKIAPMVTTWRLITPVMAMSPTFWLNEVLGRPPKIPAIAEPTPSA